jgi:hypothetical protein
MPVPPQVWLGIVDALANEDELVAAKSRPESARLETKRAPIPRHLWRSLLLAGTGRPAIAVATRDGSEQVG